MSILLSVFLLVGVASSKTISNHNDAERGAGNEPIELPEARRICAALCMSGLGGKPCGGECLSIQPAGYDPQSVQNITGQTGSLPGSSRRDACPLLCQYELGDPLCECKHHDTFDSIFFEINFNEICAFFCTKYNYRIYGCRSCSSHGEYKEKPITYLTREEERVDWDLWCKDKCAVGDGGVACNCDILPLRNTREPTKPAE